MKKYIFLITLIVSFLSSTSQESIDSLFEDVQYLSIKVKNQDTPFFTSGKVDFFQIPSTITDDVDFAIVVYKPVRPSGILILSHGWHMSVKPPQEQSNNPYPEFLTVQVDMRGRKFSTGQPDCNGYELYDFYDAYKYIIRNYSEYISDTSQVYFVGGSGGGGNGYALAGKFPDLFCSAVIMCGISDYANWFREDSIGEFRDEMLPWIGYSPEENPEAYRSRSGITTVNNLLTPIYIIHGETDVRVPVSHARNFVIEGKKKRKDIYYLELKNVGTRQHWGNISEKQEKEKMKVQGKGLEFHEPPRLPKKGRMIVAGYLITKHFEVFMDSIDSVGEVKYNLDRKRIKFTKGKGTVKWK